MNDTTITLTGNLVEDPELRFTPSGTPVTRFRVASTPRYQDRGSGQWKDGDTLFLTCNAWRQLAENIAESSLHRGMRVIVTGRLAQRTHDTENDGKRTVYEIQAHEVGVSLRSATATVTRADLGQAEDTASGNGDEPPF